MSCLVQDAAKVAKGEAIAHFASAQDWVELGLEVAADASALVVSTMAKLSGAVAVRFVVLLSVYVLDLDALFLIYNAYGSSFMEPWSSKWNVAKIKLPQDGKGMGG
jgi:hypothetical protein